MVRIGTYRREALIVFLLAFFSIFASYFDFENILYLEITAREIKRLPSFFCVVGAIKKAPRGVAVPNEAIIILIKKYVS